MSLASFLTSHKKQKEQVHTHTWFAAGAQNNRTGTLHIPSEDVPQLRRLLVSDVSKGKQPAATQGGCASVTEKMTKGVPFRFAADLDFKASEVRKWAQDKGYTDERIILARLKKKLRDITLLYRTVVSEMTSTNTDAVRMIIATRLPYKIHLYFPEVITDTKGAKAISVAFAQKFKEQHSEIFNDAVVDSSIYTTGLRMLYCHKGGMTNAVKREQELQDHEALFGANTYSDSYYVTDLDTWEVNKIPLVSDLESTSVLAADDAVLTKLRIVSGGKDKGKRKSKVSTTTGTKEQGDSNINIINTLSFLSGSFRINSNEIRPDELTTRGESVIIPTRSRQCPFAGREHNGNQLYFVLTADYAELRCHDHECTATKKLKLPKDAKLEVGSLLKGDEDQLEIIGSHTQLDQLTAFRGILSQPIGSKAEVAKMDFTPAEEKMTPMGYWTCTLPRNRYCPVCRSGHDRPENFVQVSPLGHRGIGCNLRHGDFYPDPVAMLPMSSVSVLFKQVINNYGSAEEALNLADLFPIVEDVFPDDEVLNTLMFESLKGFDSKIGAVLHHLGKGKFGYCVASNGGDEWWCWDKNEGKWLSDAMSVETFCREDVANKYITLQRFYTDRSGDSELDEKRRCKLDTIVRRLMGAKERQNIMHEAAISFRTSCRHFQNLLDAKKDVLAFAGGKVYDMTLMQMRETESFDYVTHTAGYVLPEQVDAPIRAVLLELLAAMIPDPVELHYLLKSLASSLDGYNREEIFTIWTGIGRNGKGVLRDLMMAALGEYGHIINANFLTRERPSSSSPCPDLLNLKGKRFVAGSEPEKGARMNAGFVKFLSGRDPITGRFLHQNDEISFEPQHSLFLLCNDIPDLDSEDDASWTRARIEHFPIKFVDQPVGPYQKKIDMTIKDKIQAWGPHFMLLLIEYYPIYRREGLTPSPGILASTAATRKENDIFQTWIDDNLLMDSEGVLSQPECWKRFQKAYPSAKQKDLYRALKSFVGADPVQQDALQRSRGWVGYRFT